MVTAPTPVSVALGDGVGPEIMTACLRILEAGGARLAPEFIDLGEAVWRAGHSSGMTLLAINSATTPESSTADAM